jgi:uncharacterized membrane protein
MNPRPPGHILAAMSDEPTRSPLEQGAGRLEAFSDAVMAVIITLLAFQLKVPDGVTRQAIDDAVPSLLLYVLCFVLIAIYWNNHHHLLRAADRISGAAMWANMGLLFCLSLFPFGTAWMGETGFASLPVAAYGVVLLAAALGYYVLVRVLIRTQPATSPLAAAIGTDTKGKISPVIYAASIPIALVAPWVSFALFAVVALLWIVPDQRIERQMVR